jgi:hypothetical protein
LLGKVNAQEFIPQEPAREVIFKNLKTGNEAFNKLLLQLVLSTQNNQYEQEVVSKSGRRYKLFVIHNLFKSLSLEHWVIELREIVSKRGKKENLGNNLFEGIQVFPKEPFARGDDVGVLYPEEKAVAFTSDNKPLYGNGNISYFFKSVRKINIENFCVVIKVGDYKFNEKNQNKLDLFEVFIEFTTTCKEN